MSHIPTPVPPPLGGAGVVLPTTSLPIVNLFSQTASVTIANTTSETTLTGTGVGSMTIPANLLLVGEMFELTAWGYYTTRPVVTGNLTLRVKAGSTTLASIVQSAIAPNLGTSQWHIEAIMTIRASGVSGSIMTQACGQCQVSSSSTIPVIAVNTSPTSVDLSAGLVLDLTAQWGTADASNSITLTNLVVT